MSLDLNVEIRRLTPAEALWRKPIEAQRDSIPIIMNNWIPNWTDARVEGEFIQLPNYVPDCVSEPAWGMNKLLPYDCSYPTGAWIKK